MAATAGWIDNRLVRPLALLPAPSSATLADNAKRIRVYIEGDDLYTAMLQDIANANSSVRLETYIYASDEVGQMLGAALIERAINGVQVRLRLDALGSLGLVSREHVHQLEAAGVKVEWCRRWHWRRPFDLHRRNHRKLLIVDQRCFYLGGFNLHRESSQRAYGPLRWRDTQLRVVGPLVDQAIAVFDDYEKPRRRRRRWRDLRTEDGYLVPSLGFMRRFVLHRLYRWYFRRAARRLWITTPYFVPPSALQRAMLQAAARGVDVRILVPRRSDVPLAQWASRAVYARLLNGGVRIYEYLPRMLHAKVALVDNTWAAVGTANLDYRSMFINDELVLMLVKPEVCAELASQFESDLQQAEEITRDRWSRRSLLHLIAEVLGWLSRRWL